MFNEEREGEIFREASSLCCIEAFRRHLCTRSSEYGQPENKSGRKVGHREDMLRLLHYGTDINTGRIYNTSSGHISCLAGLTQNDTEPRQSFSELHRGPRHGFKGKIYYLLYMRKSFDIWMTFSICMHTL